MRRVLGIYVRIGRGVGGILGVVVFLAVWIYFISRLGLVFGIALGWVPATLVAILFSYVVAWVWAPLLVVMTLMVAAPAWDRHGDVKRWGDAAAGQAVKGITWLDERIEKGVIWVRREARDEGLMRR